MAFKMKGYTYPGESPMKQDKGKNYESSKGDQQGPIPKDNIKLQKSEHPDTYVYKGKSEFERINDLEERKSFIQEVEFNLGESTKQQKKDKANLEREAEIMRDRIKNKEGKKSYYANKK